MVDYGGELSMWNAWVLGDVPPTVKNAFRAVARKIPSLQADLMSIEQPTDGVRAEDALRNMLQVTAYLSSNPNTPNINDQLAPIVLKRGAINFDAEYATWFDTYLRPFMAEKLELPVDATTNNTAGLSERLKEALFGEEVLKRYQEVAGWLAKFKESNSHDLALPRMLLRLGGEELLKDEPSFAVSVKAHLNLFCRKNGLRPKGNLHPYLQTAFERIDHDEFAVMLRTLAEKLA
jgi:hypothetical protein